MTTISIIAARGRNRVIGRDNALPWELPADMERFMTLTMGHPIIMGRKTHESIGEVLPGRTNIVLSRRKDTYAPGCVVVKDPRDAVELAKVSTGGDGEGGEIFVIGGGEVFSHFLSLADRLYLTFIDEDFQGDVVFPELDLEDGGEWVLDSLEKVERGEKNPYGFEFRTYQRFRPAPNT